jgi:hypothetical protein
MLGVILANAGVLQAVHTHQQRARRSDPASAERRAAHGHHDPDTCPFCIQFTLGNKTVSPDFDIPLGFTLGAAQEVVSLWTFFPRGVFLPSSPARAPPSICA